MERKYLYTRDSCFVEERNGRSPTYLLLYILYVLHCMQLFHDKCMSHRISIAFRHDGNCIVFLTLLLEPWGFGFNRPARIYIEPQVSPTCRYLYLQVHNACLFCILNQPVHLTFQQFYNQIGAVNGIKYRVRK